MLEYDQDGYIKLPKDKSKKIEVLGKLYKSLSHLGSDKEIFAEIRAITNNSVSERSLFYYKKQGGWGKAKSKGKNKRRKTQKPPDQKKIKPKEGKAKKEEKFAEEVTGEQAELRDGTYMPVVAPDVYSGYSKETKVQIVQLICQYWETAFYKLQDLCEAQGIRYSTFHKWVNNDYQLYNLYWEAREKKQLNFVALMEENLQNSFMKEVQTDYIEEVRKDYQVKPTINPETGEVEMQEQHVGSTVYKKPNQTHPHTRYLVLQMVNEMKGEVDKVHNTPYEGIEYMDDEKLDAEIEKLENETKDLEDGQKDE